MAENSMKNSTINLQRTKVNSKVFVWPMGVVLKENDDTNQSILVNFINIIHRAIITASCNKITAVPGN